MKHLGRIKICLWVVLGCLALVPILLSQDEEEPAGPLPEPKLYRFSSDLKAGDKFTVAEEQKWDGTIEIKAESETHQFPFLKSIQNQYTEEIIEGTSLEVIKSKRIYTGSQVKSNLPKEGIKTETTSLEGKTLMLETAKYQAKILENVTKENPTVLKEDLQYLNAFTQFNGLLPKMAIKEGDDWIITTQDFGHVVFGDDYDDEKCSVKGKGVFEEIVDYPKEPGTSCAKISLNLTIRHDETETTPALETELTGLCFCSLEQGVILSLDLSGQFTLKKEVKEDKETGIPVTTSGNITIRKRLK